MTFASMSTLVKLLAWLVLTLSCCWVTHSKTFNLGVLLPYTGHWPVGRTAAGAVGHAIHQVNTDPSLSALRQGGHYFNFTWRDTGCEESRGLAAMVDIWAHDGPIDAFIGPACDEICMPAGLLAAEWGLPMVSFGCASTALSNKVLYPTFARTLAPYDHMHVFLESIMHHFQWKKICIISSQTRMWQVTATQMQLKLERARFNVGHVQFFQDDHDIQLEEKALRHRALLQESKSHYRVFLLSCGVEDTRDFLLHASDLGMINGDYVFISIQTLLSARYGVNTWHGDDGRDNDSMAAFEGLLDLANFIPDDLRGMEHAVRYYLTQPPFNDPMPETEQIDSHVELLYDAIWLYALAVNRSLTQGTHPNDSRAISTNLFNVSFTGMQGEVFVDHRGDTTSKYSLRNVQNGSLVVVINYEPGSNVTSDLVITNASIRWPGGGWEVIPDHPKCGWHRSRCNNHVATTVAASIMATLAVIVFVVATGYFLYRKRRAILDSASTEWKIIYSDLQMDNVIGSKAFGSRFSRRVSGFTESTMNSDFNTFTIRHLKFGVNNQTSLQRSGSLGSSIGSKNQIGGENHLSNMGQMQVFTKLGYFRGQIVAIKTIRKPYIYLTKEITHELNERRNVRHVNLNPFIGACVDPNHICVVTTYCSKGSLQDVLENENIKLDRIFKLSFAADIALGMSYLHSSSIGFHGRLKSSNVLIDSRWTCKISDFGLRKFREGERLAGLGDHSYYYQLLWTAPEHLREDDHSRVGSQKGDVYSFAIILQEIVMRTGPYDYASENPQEVIEKVKLGVHPPHRPKVFLEENEEELFDLMRLCWEEIFFFRPSFVTIKDSLRKMNQGRPNLVDQMMLMMEKYADHLEDLVQERTEQLAEEQKKTDELLGRMLPRSVAEQLKLGRNIQPEMYRSATVFFSDVVGFTSMAAASTPLEVVNFLNDLYTCFDNILEHFDVYKVETIGDAYMVGSGLPVRNGNRHAGEICTMALELLSAINTFVIRHEPDKQLQLRIGIHTGPVVAGVVGLKMPRYCLFGDTVNYASRMESSGLALRIHISPDTKKVLDHLGGYHLKKRGMVTLKGRGSVTTYYLTGKDGFNKPLPDLSKAARLEDHEFK